MGKIHPNWIIRQHLSDDHDDLVEAAKSGKPAPKRRTEKAVKPKPETPEG